MRFSAKKKKKMRKINQRRISRCCGDMIGCRIDYEHGGYEVRDQVRITGVIYLLVQVEDGNYAIYKIVKVGEYVRLSSKKVLKRKEQFSNRMNWKNFSTIKINEDGEIISVERGNRHGPYKM